MNRTAQPIVATMTNGGRTALFAVPVTPVVVATEERAMTPPVTPCTGSGGTIPPNRHGTASAGRVHATPTDALAAFLATQPTLFDRGYTELHLPDRSIAYAREDTYRRGLFLYVIHVAPASGGWFVDRWEVTGC